MTCEYPIKQRFFLGLLIGFYLGLLLIPLLARAVTTPDPAIFFSTTAETALVPSRAIVSQLPVSTQSATTSIKALVVSAFPDKPVMVRIAQCESVFRQFKSPGVVLMGGGGNNYVGIFQIGKQWVPRAESLGMNIYTPEGNIAFARYLLDNAGLTQWECYTKNSGRDG